MMKNLLAKGAVVAAFLLFSHISSFAHCEIPCGIYDDEARFKLLAEDITTVEKSINQIVELSAAGDKNYNQLVRWINNKELHADKLMETVTRYFMTQRVIPVEPADAAGYADYTKKVTLLHQMLVEAMKCKQTTDLAHTEKLRQLLAEFQELYNAGHGH